MELGKCIQGNSSHSKEIDHDDKLSFNLRLPIFNAIIINNYIPSQKLPMSGESMEEVNTELDKLDNVLEVVFNSIISSKEESSRLYYYYYPK